MKKIHKQTKSLNADLNIYLSTSTGIGEGEIKDKNFPPIPSNEVIN